jgi:hypothetical protein
MWYVKREVRHDGILAANIHEGLSGDWRVHQHVMLTLPIHGSHRWICRATTTIASGDRSSRADTRNGELMSQPIVD